MKQLILYTSQWDAINEVFGDSNDPNHKEMHNQLFQLLWDNGLIDHNQIELHGNKGFVLKEGYRNLSKDVLKKYAKTAKEMVVSKGGKKNNNRKSRTNSTRLLTPVIDYIDNKIKNWGSSYDPDAIDAETKNPVAKQVQDQVSGKPAGTQNQTSPSKKPNLPVKKDNPPTQKVVVVAKPKWTALPDKTIIERVAGTNPGEAYVVQDKDTLSQIAKGWNVPLKDLYDVEDNAAYEKNPKKLRVGQLVYRPGLPATVKFVDNSLSWESQPLVAVIEEEPQQEVVKLVRDEDNYVPDYEAYLQQEYPDMVEQEMQFVPYSKRQQRFLQRNRDALRQAYKYDLKNGTDTYWQMMSKMPTKRVGGVLNPLPKRRI